MRLFFLLFIFIFLSCSENKEPINIEGNWYIGSLPTNENKDLEIDKAFVYQELYISKNQFFYHSNILGYKTPNFYKIENDTLFLRFAVNEIFEPIGKVITNKREFSIIDKKDTLTFFKLERVTNTLDKFIKKKDSIYIFEQEGMKYTQGFLNRENEYLAKLKSKKE